MQNSLHHTTAMFGMISIRFLAWALYEGQYDSYKDLEHKNKGIQKGQYFKL